MIAAIAVQTYPVSLYVLLVLAVSLAICFIPGIRQGPKVFIFLALAWLGLGPFWTGVFQRVWHSNQLILSPSLWANRETKAKVVKQEANIASLRSQISSYTHAFLTAQAYSAFTKGERVLMDSDEAKAPAVWERFEKGLTEKNYAVGTWNDRRVFKVAYNTLRWMSALGPINHSYEIPTDDNFAGVQPYLSEAQVNALFSYLQIMDPDNRTDFNGFYEGAILQGKKNDRLGRSPVVVEEDAPQERARSVDVHYTADQVQVSQVRAVGRNFLYVVTTPDGIQHNVVAPSESAAKDNVIGK